MRQPHTAPSRQPDPDDIAFWPDGEWARLDVVWSYGFEWKSDDYEIVARTDAQRLAELGIDLDLA
jgi:hypothetical protein